MKKKCIVDTSVMNIIVRKNGIHFHYMFYEKIIGVIIGRVVDNNEQAHDANGEDR